MSVQGLAAAVATLLAAVFVAAGLVKLTHPRMFAEELAAYRLLPSATVAAAGAVLAVSEIAAGTLVWVPATRAAAGAVLIALLLVFAMAAAAVLARGERRISCACFGRSSHTVSWALPARNVLLAAVVATGLGYEPALGPSELSVWATALIAGTALVLGLEYIDMRERSTAEEVA